MLSSSTAKALITPDSGYDPAAWLPCRRITNRQSAQRMRRKRMDDLQTVMDQVNVLQSENDDLRATQRR